MAEGGRGPKQPVDPARAYRLINPGGILLLTAATAEARNLMPLAWHMPLSFDPPLVAIAVGQSRFTAHLIARSGEFALNVPPAELVEKVYRAGKISAAGGEDKFSALGLTPTPAARVRAPLIAECQGHVECRVDAEYPGGDHRLFVGRVLAASAVADFFDGAWRLGPGGTALLHHLGGGRFALADKAIEVGSS